MTIRTNEDWSTPRKRYADDGGGRAIALLMEPMLLNVNDAARVMATSPKTLAAMTSEHGLSPIRRNGLVRYDLNDLRELVQRIKNPRRL